MPHGDAPMLLFAFSITYHFDKALAIRHPRPYNQDRHNRSCTNMKQCSNMAR